MDTFQPKRVLIVDDMATNRLLVKHFLTASSYEVDEAASGIEALDVLQKNSVDAVLLDVMMPGKDGFELCEELRQQARFINLPIILISVLDGEEDKNRAVEVGATDYLCKPFRHEMLMEKLEKAISGE